MGGKCAALITRSDNSTAYEGKWAPRICNDPLPFACRVNKGIDQILCNRMIDKL